MCKAIRMLEQRAADKMKVATRLEDIKSLMEKIGWTAEESMDALAIPEGDREACNCNVFQIDDHMGDLQF